jgi:exodeoxyribonuclease VII small subunit
MSYESDLQRLSAILGELDASDVPLERALQLFQEGIERLRSASTALERAEGHVRTLVERPDGTLDVIAHDGG